MTKRAYTSLITFTCCLIATQAAEAEFSLNFQPIDNSAYRSTSYFRGSDLLHGQTPFVMEGNVDLQLPERTIDPDTGLAYYHVVVGDQADGFIQEVFIQAGFRTFQGNPGSAVGGEGDVNGGNGRDPLDSDPNIYTANGEANPKRVLIRQIVDDGEIFMEYLKDKYDKKALITQSISSPDMQSEFSIDMRNSGFDDNTTPGIIINTMTLTGVGVGAFDLATDVQSSSVTGGRYTYTDGDGLGGSAGTYEYVDGGYDVYSQDWEVFFDNTEANPWSYDGNRPTP